jgi:hypothetical protein
MICTEYRRGGRNRRAGSGTVLQAADKDLGLAPAALAAYRAEWEGVLVDG